jgi:hypothetical protein
MEVLTPPKKDTTSLQRFSKMYLNTEKSNEAQEVLADI